MTFFLLVVNKLPDGKIQVQVVSWYDNENSYISQMVRAIKYFSKLLQLSVLQNRIIRKPELPF